MQRSRRALLLRRALESSSCSRSHMYKVSLSFVVLWGLVFLVNLWISFGDGHTDRSFLHPVGMSTWDETKLECRENSNVMDALRLEETDPLTRSKDSHNSNEITTSSSSGIFSNEEPKTSFVAQRDNVNGLLVNGEHAKMEDPVSRALFQGDSQKTNWLSRTVPLGLDEFKSRAFMSKSKSIAEEAGNIIHRVDPDGTEYNYASASKGAKVLAFNKEAKGASNILIRDKDKYLRNPCSAEEKFVVVELSEETLVDTIEIANFEHYSSNLKDFELHGTLIYPTDIWIKIGNFTAANAKYAQRFVLQEPKWVRYVKINILSHYGSEFYCTLSVFEVYGVDAVERLLEDLISVQDNSFSSEDLNGDKKIISSQPRSGNEAQKNGREKGSLSAEESSDELQEIMGSNVPDLFEEMRHHHAGRMPGDTVLKILMQKVRSLDINLSILERYLEELNFKYGSIFKEFDKDIAEKTKILEKIQADVTNLLKNEDDNREVVRDLISWKSAVSSNLDHLRKDNTVLRWEMEKMGEKQRYLEKKGVVVFVVCIIFSVLALLRLACDVMMSVFLAFGVESGGTSQGSKFCSTSLSSWLVLLLGCTIVLLIESL